MTTVALSAPATDRPARRPVEPATAMALGGAGLAAAVAAALLASPWILLAWLLPDLGLLAGITREFGERGRLAPRAVRLYNALHALPGPAALTLAGMLVPALVAPGLIWLSHVLADRALGYGLRAPDGFQRA